MLPEIGTIEINPLNYEQEGGVFVKKSGVRPSISVGQTKKSSRKMLALKIVLGALLIAGICGTGLACLFRNPTLLMYPLHASCNVTWTLKQDCNTVANKIVQRIETWKTNETCGTGQKCLYTLDSVEKNVITAHHTTPVKAYVDDLTFTFYPNTVSNGCNVLGYSTSRLWYAILDYGTNYCNIHNLVDGAGLRSDEHYSELTSDSICTQYTSANCDKY